MGNRLPLRFDRHEVAGAFGDLGTDVPLILLLIVVCKLDARGVLILFGVCQVFAGLAYRLPVPVQPLKAMATIALAAGAVNGGRPITADVLAAGALTAGAMMLALSLTGGLGLIARVVPKLVVRGLQLGLGIKLGLLALRYVVDAGPEGYALGGLAFVIILLLRGNRHLPPALPVLALALAYALAFKAGWRGLRVDLPSALPTPHAPALDDILAGLVLLALPQLPLSIGNAVLATRQTIHDIYGRDVSIRKLGLTYAVCNLTVPWFGGIGICHGSGGVAGHHAFGARTGGAPIIYGATFILVAVVLGENAFTLIDAFPKSVLGAMLLFEAAALMLLTRDAAGKGQFFLVAMVGLLAAGLRSYGFCIALVAGTLVYYLIRWVPRRGDDEKDPATRGGNHA